MEAGGEVQLEKEIGAWSVRNKRVLCIWQVHDSLSFEQVSIRVSGRVVGWLVGDSYSFCFDGKEWMQYVNS